MGVIWIIEKSKPDMTSVSSHLIGDFAVRLFASFPSFQKLVRVQRSHLPDLVMVDMDDCQTKRSVVTAFLADALPGCPAVFMGRAANHFTDTSEYPQNFLLKPMDPLSLSRFAANLMGKSCLEGAGSELRFKDLALPADLTHCRIGGYLKPVELPRKEALLLKMLMQTPGTCLSRNEIQRAIWKDVAVSKRTIDSHVSRLRRRLDGSEVSIRSVYAGGYILE